MYINNIAYNSFKGFRNNEEDETIHTNYDLGKLSLTSKILLQEFCKKLNELNLLFATLDEKYEISKEILQLLPEFANFQIDSLSKDQVVSNAKIISQEVSERFWGGANIIGHFV